MAQRILGVLVAAVLLAGCRGIESENPPIHPNLNMDFQQRLDPQEGFAFFADGRAMRTPVAGTVARGWLREDDAFYQGRLAGGGFVAQMPIPTTREVLVRGQERYHIFCTPCHGGAGDGQGIVTTGGFGFTPAPTFHDDRLRSVEDGYVYHVITHGVRTMPAYNTQIPVADRWAIVAYVRALQRSQHAGAADVPADVLSGLRQGGAPAAAPQAAPADTSAAGAPQQ